MKAGKWFLPDVPDVLGMLCDQASVTVEGIDAFADWANGDSAAADRVRACEHQADARKWKLRGALKEAFTTPLEPEDIFELSRGLDEVLNSAKNTVREAEVMHVGPDRAIGEMAAELQDGTRALRDAVASLEHGGDGDATRAADKAVACQRRLEHVYRSAMSALVDVGDIREVAAKRELYRRISRTSDLLVDVAERVWYSVLKEA